MPRGAEYADEPPASDNAIESGENKIAGADSGATSEVDRSGKAAPLPEGVSEMKDGTGSGGGSQGLTGVGSGKGANNDINIK
ncbi:MAG: hypothetical protein Q9195_005607 [Heterodermia aff. obscurata]